MLCGLDCLITVTSAQGFTLWDARDGMLALTYASIISAHSWQIKWRGCNLPEGHLIGALLPLHLVGRPLPSAPHAGAAALVAAVWRAAILAATSGKRRLAALPGGTSRPRRAARRRHIFPRPLQRRRALQRSLDLRARPAVRLRLPLHLRLTNRQHQLTLRVFIRAVW